MSIFPSINLANLQSPKFAQADSRQTIVEDLRQYIKGYYLSARKKQAAIDGQINEQVEEEIKKILAEPMIEHLLELFASREIAIHQRLGEALKGVLLASASGSNLDHAVALYGVKRLVIKVADPQASPPTEALTETDKRLRLRARLSLESLSQAGCAGAYLFYALSASPHIKDVSIYVPDYSNKSSELAGEVKVYILTDAEDPNPVESVEGEESESDRIINKVKLAMQTMRSVTDSVEVKLARVQEYHVEAKLILTAASNEQTVIDSAYAAVSELAAENFRLGKNIVRSEFFSALYQPDVLQVVLTQPATDQAIPIDTVPWLSPPADDVPKINITTNMDNGGVINE